MIAQISSQSKQEELEANLARADDLARAEALLAIAKAELDKAEAALMMAIMRDQGRTGARPADSSAVIDAARAQRDRARAAWRSGQLLRDQLRSAPVEPARAKRTAS